VAIPTKKDRDEITVARSIFDEIVEFTEHEETPKEKNSNTNCNTSEQSSQSSSNQKIPRSRITP